ncbi:MAG: hypothetical protein K1X91_11825 [Bacteriodetes bacterium]|nr:hypothetical protein [Bacteroidota bacterium]
MNPIEQPLADIFAKLPVFPENVKDIFRKLLPWLMIIVGVIALLGWLVVLGLSTVALGLSSFAGTMPSYMGNIGTYVIMPVTAALSLFGGILMLQGKKLGWDFALYYQVLTCVLALLSFNIFGAVWDILWIWVLFQIREYFTRGSDTVM